MKQLQQAYYTRRGWKHRPLVLPLETEIRIPEDYPVRLAGAELEELAYRKLYRAYSSKGRKYAADPRIMNGIYSSRKLEKACCKHIDFMWLLEGGHVHMFNSHLKTGYNVQIRLTTVPLSFACFYPPLACIGDSLPYVLSFVYYFMRLA